MGAYIALAIIIAAVLIASSNVKSNKKKAKMPQTTVNNPETEPEEKEENLPIDGAYQKRWIFSYNEKDAFRKLKETTDKLNCQTLAKVRLLDLLEPVSGNKKYKTYFWKVQAKHVDFVILDEKLITKCIVELDDNSHNAVERKERDKFVDDVLTSVGYKIIHAKAISPEVQQQIAEILGKGELK